MGEHFYQDSSGHWQFSGSNQAGGSSDSGHRGYSLIPTLKVGETASTGDASIYANKLNLVDIYKENAAAIVLINGNKSSQKGPLDVAGSGFFLTSDGVVSTDLHVVQGTRNLTVTTADGEQLPAHVIATDPAIDAALLQVDTDPSQTFKTITPGDSTQVGRGGPLVAIGHPQGWSNEFVSEGSLTRHTTMGNEASDIQGGLQPGEDPNRGVLKASLHVEPGSSGSPLFDERTGAVVGMVDTASPVKAESTPIEDVMRLLYRTRGVGQGDAIASTLNLHLKPDDAPVHHNLTGLTRALDSAAGRSGSGSTGLANDNGFKHPISTGSISSSGWLQRSENYLSGLACRWTNSC